MLRNLLLTIGIVLATSLVVFPQTFGSLQGKVIDNDTKEELPFVNIVLEIDGSQLGGASSDINGKYVIKPIPPGKYDHDDAVCSRDFFPYRDSDASALKLECSLMLGLCGKVIV